MLQDDQTVVQNILKGDRTYVRTLYDRYEAYWFKICLRYSRNYDEANDMFQEGIAQVFQKLDQHNSERGSFKAWANRVLINQILKFLNKHQWNQSFKDLELARSRQDYSISALDTLNEKEIIKMIQTLPTGYRIVFNMFEIEGFSHKEIAAQLNIKEGTSKSQLFKAKKMLQSKLETFLEK